MGENAPGSFFSSFFFFTASGHWARFIARLSLRQVSIADLCYRDAPAYKLYSPDLKEHACSVQTPTKMLTFKKKFNVHFVQSK